MKRPYKRKIYITPVVLDDETIAALDARRGKFSRSLYLRRLVLANPRGNYKWKPKPCIRCGITFQPTNSTSVDCSIDCRIGRYSSTGPSGCIDWTGPTGYFGYGVIVQDRRSPTLRATRVIWERERGPIPKGLVVRHKCDRPVCINIEHLELGTQADNVMDMKERGRLRPPLNRGGEDHHAAKLNRVIVADIRKRVARGEKQYKLADEYGVGRMTVSRIIRGEAWKNK